MNPSNKPCNCYVNKLSQFAQFSIRRGAHATGCPEYRESRDPVDRMNDADIRQMYTKGNNNAL